MDETLEARKFKDFVKMPILEKSDWVDWVDFETLKFGIGDWLRHLYSGRLWTPRNVYYL